ncbi:MAG: hypothetical protein WAT71_08400 [Ignavibacteria bacterium]
MENMKRLKNFCSALNFCFKLSLIVCLIFFSGCSDENKNDKQNEQIEVKKFSDKNSNDLENEIPEEESGEEYDEDVSDNLDLTVSSEKVKDHIGKLVTVKGIISNVYVSEKVAYLNFGNKFPKNDFSGVVFAGKFSEFEDLESFKDKLVEITGSVSVFRNKPQIILNSPDQIKIIK